MSQLLPFRSEVEVTRESPRVVALDGEESEAVFSALASDTSRAIYRTLYQKPSTASQVAEAVDTSVQNVRYHLEKLEDAELIDAVDTWYSSRGNEMTVYAATDQALIVAGDKHQQSELRSLLKSTAGAVGVLAVLSVAVQWLASEFLTEQVRPMDNHGSDNVAIAMEVESVEMLAVEPGLLVFLGGILVILLLAGRAAMQIRSMGD